MYEQGYFSEDLAMLCDRSAYKEMPDNESLLNLIRGRLEELLSA